MKLCLALISCLGFLSIASAGIPVLPLYEMSNAFAPYIDDDGYARPIVNLGKVDLGEGLSMPLLIDFSSAIRSPSPEFGQGWDCPLFDAKLVDTQENVKRLTTLGGRTLYLVYNPRTDSWKHAFSDHWTGQAKGDDFDLAYDGVWKFGFHDGLISSMTTPGGRTIRWNRSGEKLTSMGETGKPPALQIVYDKLGFAKQILVSPDAMGVAKKTYDFEPSLVYAGIEKIHCPDGRDIAFNRSRDKSLNPVMDWTDTKWYSTKLSWDVNTGKILKGDDYTYSVTETSPDGSTCPRMARTNNLTHKVETFYYDEKRGVTDMTLPDGTLRHIEMDNAPGPNYKEIRLVQETKNGKTHIVMRRSFDEQNHLLMQVIGLPNGRQNVSQFVYDKAGRAVSEFFNGKLLWKNEYDPVTGVLTARELPVTGVKLSFTPIAGGGMKETVEKAAGQMASTQTYTTEQWQARAADLQSVR